MIVFKIDLIIVIESIFYSNLHENICNNIRIICINNQVYTMDYAI